ncbi:MAG: hypothetical protein H7Z12_05950 [Rhodospirillaceae bacterium]|nr:hypothetical protein [Rhodospirillales bacterium]
MKAIGRLSAIVLSAVLLSGCFPVAMVIECTKDRSVTNSFALDKVPSEHELLAALQETGQERILFRAWNTFEMDMAARQQDGELTVNVNDFVPKLGTVGRWAVVRATGDRLTFTSDSSQFYCLEDPDLAKDHGEFVTTLRRNLVKRGIARSAE